jgi:hypothetical protein
LGNVCRRCGGKGWRWTGRERVACGQCGGAGGLELPPEKRRGWAGDPRPGIGSVNRSDFDLLLRAGQERERSLRAIFHADIVTIECKDEHLSRTHVFIEHECYGKPSGLAITAADYWAIEVRRGWWVLIPTDDLRMLWRVALDQFGLRHGGDLGVAFGAIVPKVWLVNR